ncbi:MAG: pyridoxamine 5'-phosphate oxidase family protein [Bacteroidota bacterium]
MTKTKEQKGDKDQDLSDHDAIEKLKELIKHNSICMFATNLDEHPIEARPMSVAQVDDNGTLWFLNGKSTEKTHDIAADSHVQLFFSNTSDQEYLTVYGEASVTKDKAKIKELWSPIAKAWFTEGVDDPDITAIRVEPQNAFYWDTKNGRMISLIKILASAVTGKTIEEGVRGKLSV